VQQVKIIMSAPKIPAGCGPASHTKIFLLIYECCVHFCLEQAFTPSLRTQLKPEPVSFRVKMIEKQII